MSSATTIKRPYLSLEEAAALAGVHRETLAKAIARGDLKATKPFITAWRIHRDDFEAFMRGGSR